MDIKDCNLLLAGAVNDPERTFSLHYKDYVVLELSGNHFVSGHFEGIAPLSMNHISNHFIYMIAASGRRELFRVDDIINIYKECDLCLYRDSDVYCHYSFVDNGKLDCFVPDSNHFALRGCK